MKMIRFMWNSNINIWWKFQWSTVINFWVTPKKLIKFPKKLVLSKNYHFFFNFDLPKVATRFTEDTDLKACLLSKMLLTDRIKNTHHCKTKTFFPSVQNLEKYFYFLILNILKLIKILLVTWIYFLNLIIKKILMVKTFI